MKDRRLRRIHFSWFVAWLSAGFLAGVAVSPRIPGTVFTSPEWLMIAGLLFLAAAIRRSVLFIVLAAAAGMIIGFWHGGLASQALSGYEQFYNQTVVVSGKVIEDTSYGPRGDQRLRLGQVLVNNNSLPGTIWISTPDKLEIKRGDLAAFKGRLSKGFGNLPAAVYKAQTVAAQRPYPGDVGRRARDWFAVGIHRSIPEPQSSLGIGYLVGQRRSLPEDLNEQLRIVGLTHAIVASGYNLTILVAFTRRALARFSKYLTVLTGGALIGGFIMITGLSPSMSRAGLVSGLGLAAWYYGRSVHPLVLLPFSAAITIFLNPYYIWGDIGWYLSFAAFAGVLVLAPLLNQFFWGKERRPGVLREILVATTAAQIATMPIIIFAFGQYSLYALPANLLVLPLVPLAMLLTFMAGLSGILLPQLAFILAAPATALLHYNTAVVGWMAGLPGAQGEFSLSALGLIGGYCMIILLCAALWRRTRYNFRSQDTLM